MLWQSEEVANLEALGKVLLRRRGLAALEVQLGEAGMCIGHAAHGPGRARQIDGVTTKRDSLGEAALGRENIGERYRGTLHVGNMPRGPEPVPALRPIASSVVEFALRPGDDTKETCGARQCGVVARRRKF
jgi:hypothetical protein